MQILLKHWIIRIWDIIHDVRKLVFRMRERLYLWIAYCFYSMYYVIFVKWHGAHVVYADLDRTDVTWIMHAYYLTDQRMSISSLYMWLKKFGMRADGEKLRLVFRYLDRVHESLIDFDASMELHTQSEDVNMDFHEIPSVKLVALTTIH